MKRTLARIRYGLVLIMTLWAFLRLILVLFEACTGEFGTAVAYIVRAIAILIAAYFAGKLRDE